MTILGVNAPFHSIPYLFGVVVALFGLFESKPTKQKLGLMVVDMIALNALALIPYTIQQQQDLLWPYATIVFMSASQTYLAMRSIQTHGIKGVFKLMAAYFALGNLTMFGLILFGVIGS